VGASVGGPVSINSVIDGGVDGWSEGGLDGSAEGDIVGGCEGNVEGIGVGDDVGAGVLGGLGLPRSWFVGDTVGDTVGEHMTTFRLSMISSTHELFSSCNTLRSPELLLLSSRSSRLPFLFLAFPLLIPPLLSSIPLLSPSLFLPPLEPDLLLSPSFPPLLPALVVASRVIPPLLLFPVFPSFVPPFVPLFLLIPLEEGLFLPPLLPVGDGINKGESTPSFSLKSLSPT